MQKELFIILILAVVLVSPAFGLGYHFIKYNYSLEPGQSEEQTITVTDAGGTLEMIIPRNLKDFIIQPDTIDTKGVNPFKVPLKVVIPEDAGNGVFEGKIKILEKGKPGNIMVISQQLSIKVTITVTGADFDYVAPVVEPTLEPIGGVLEDPLSGLVPEPADKPIEKPVGDPSKEPVDGSALKATLRIVQPDLEDPQCGPGTVFEDGYCKVTAEPKGQSFWELIQAFFASLF